MSGDLGLARGGGKRDKVKVSGRKHCHEAQRACTMLPRRQHESDRRLLSYATITPLWVTKAISIPISIPLLDNQVRKQFRDAALRWMEVDVCRLAHGVGITGKLLLSGSKAEARVHQADRLIVDASGCKGSWVGDWVMGTLRPGLAVRCCQRDCYRCRHRQ